MEALRRTPGARRPRPRRGTPADTRERLIAAAAAVFNRAGYHGTDSNRLARAAGYAPATFYKHFADKRAILLAAYEAWVTAEWRAISATLAATPSTDARADRIVAFVLDHHRRWKGLRASLRALVATDAVVRRFHRAQRRRQLDWLAAMRADGTNDPSAGRTRGAAGSDATPVRARAGAAGTASRTRGAARGATAATTARVDDALLLFTLERTLDAVAEGETSALGLREDVVLARLGTLVRAALGGTRPS